MTPEKLLIELEHLPHSQRVKRMIQLGRDAVGGAEGRAPDKSTATLLKSLEQRGSYERRMALYACMGSRDGGCVEAAIAHPSAIVRSLAGHLVPIICDDPTALRLLHSVDRKRRFHLIRGLRKRGRRIPVDAFLDDAIARGHRGWIELLPFASATCAARHAGAFSTDASREQWRRLARHHPAICAESLTKIAAAVEDLDARLRANVRTVLPTLGDRVPDAALLLVKSMARHVPPGELDLDALLIHRPDAVATLLIETETPGRLSFNRVAHRLEPALLLNLLTRHPNSFGAPAGWLRKLPREQRQSVYDVCALAWRNREGSLPLGVLALLPESQRQDEADRHLDLPTMATRPAQRIAYAAFLPWIRMRSLVDPLLRDPDAEIRGAALASFVAAVRFHSDRLGELLSVLTTRRNEQDPVRLIMLGALAALPPGRWKAEHLAELGLILRHALDAADASHATAAAAERIVVGLIPFQPECSRKWLTTIVSERGMLVSSLARFADTEVAQLLPSLLNVFQSWQTREREGYLISAARRIGRRLRGFDGIADILESLSRSSANDSTCESALSILSDEYRDRFNKLVPDLLKKDPSWAMRSVVSSHLHLHRQDLLEPCLGRVAYRGRFSTGETRFFIPVAVGFQRWTPTQQAKLAMTLEEITRDEKRDIPAVLRVIDQLAAMPDIEPKRLIELANLDKSRLAVRDAALRALGRSDAAQGLPTLLNALNDDRARIAIYGLRHALLQLPATAALAALQKAPVTQVTVAKEVIRLVGELNTDDAFNELLACDKWDLHRDVRTALLRALWSYLDRDQSWEILQRAVASGEPGQADVASRIPADTLNADGQIRLAALLAALLGHPYPKVRVNVLQRLIQLPLTDARRAMLPGLLSAIASPLPDESTAAASALFATYPGRQADVVGETTIRLLGNRRAIHTLVESLCTASIYSRNALAGSAGAVFKALSTDAMTISLRARLAVLVLPTAELAAFFDEAAGAGTLHADAMTAAIRAMSQIVALRGPASMELIEQSLTGHSDERLRRLALAALMVATERNQAWSADQLDRLMKYRRDPSLLVAGAALFTFPVGSAE